MSVYIVLFRGVGGATQLPTAPLRAALTEAGFEGVATYINSGNAVLRSARPRDETVEAIAKICADRFGFTKAVYAVSSVEWTMLVRNNPFPVEPGGGKFLHAAWLAETPERKAVEALEALAVDGDGVAVVGDVAYLSTPRGFSKSRLAERFDRLIGVPNTARNWNTVLKLMELAERLA